MKKTILLICLTLFSLCSFSQTCEERETKLLEVVGSLSAGYMYNTYTTIGATSDGFVKKYYEKDFTKSLLTEQTSIITSISKIMQTTIDEKKATSEDDRLFLKETIAILQGLKKQAELFLEYMEDSSEEKGKAYDAQRLANWDRMAKHLGIGDEEDE